MSQKQRIIFLILAVAVLVIVGWSVTGSLEFLLADFWFVSGLLMLLLLGVVDQPHFSRDANIFVNGVAGMISLTGVLPASRSTLWWLFLWWTIYLILSSTIIMLIRGRALRDESATVQAFSRLNRHIGRPEALFSSFFLWGVFTQFGEGAKAFRVLLLYWAVFMILNMPAISRAMATIISREKASASQRQGLVTGFLSPGVFECRLSARAEKTVLGAEATVFSADGKALAKGRVIDDRVMPGTRVGTVAITEILESWTYLAEIQRNAEVSFTDVRPSGPVPVGVVGRGTDIGTARLLVSPYLDLEKGEVLRVTLGTGEKAYYQVVSAKVVRETFESNHAIEHVEVGAGQLGKWMSDRCRFEPLNWVAPPGKLVYRAGDEESAGHRIPQANVKIGSVPNSSFPVHLNLQDAVTHNTAIIGVTGSGKTYLALHIVESLVAQGIKVLVLDISRQHWIFLEEREPFPIRRVDDIDLWLDGQQDLAVHQYAEATSYPMRTAELVERALARLAATVTLRAGENEPARVCVVFEEAHSLVPEWNQVAEQPDVQRVNRTARAILQGRKFGMGCMLVSQRTANVTKTILNQCNTIFALQSFDQTGLDFLRNYMGDEYAQAISTLPVRHGILVGKASSSTRPILMRVEDLGERWVRSEEPSEEGALQE